MPERPSGFTARALDLAGASDTAAWDDLLGRAPERTPYSTRPYAEALAEAAGLRLGALGAFESAGEGSGEGRLVAGVLTFERRRGPLRCCVVPPLTAYTPFLIDPPVREGLALERRSALDALLALVTRRFDAAAFHLSTETRDVRPFKWAGFDATPFYTYVFRPDAASRPEDQVRRRLRRASDLRVAPIAPDDDDEFHRIVRLNYAQPGRRAPITVDAQRRLFRRLDAAGTLGAVACRRDGEALESAFVTLNDAAGTYAWMIGTPKGPAATVLMDHVHRDAREHGRVFNLVGANTPSIAHFKKAFGGALVPYFRVVWVRGRLLRALGAVRPFV